MIEYEGVPIAYRVADGNGSLLGFGDYLKNLTGKNLQEVILAFVDEENETIEIKDQLDYDYFLENCLYGSKVLQIRLVAHEKAEANPEQPRQPIMDLATNSSNTSQGKTVTAQLTILLSKEIDTDIDKSSSYQLRSASLPINYSCNGLLNLHQEKESEQSQQQIADSLQTKINPGVQKSPDKTGTSQLLLQIVEQVDSLQEIIFNQIDQISQSMRQLVDKRNEDILRASELTAFHVSYQCKSCKAWPVNGKRYSCVVCPEYNLCEKCHCTVSMHQHLMVVFPAPHDEKLKIQGIAKLLDRVNSDPDTNSLAIKTEVTTVILGKRLCANLKEMLLAQGKQMSNGEYLCFILEFFE